MFIKGHEFKNPAICVYLRNGERYEHANFPAQTSIELASSVSFYWNGALRTYPLDLIQFYEVYERED